MDERLLRLLEGIPNAIGVYMLYDKNDRVIYIGKSKHINKRLVQHFKATSYREVRIQEELCRINYEIMGDETIGLLHESDLIKLHQPKYNRSLRKNRFSFGLYVHVDMDGYLSLVIEKLDTSKNEILTFTSFQEGKDRLFAITEKYNLCQKVNLLYKSKGACFQYQLKACNGACIALESSDAYNNRVQIFIKDSELPNGDVFLEVNGRTVREKGIIYIKDGAYKGFGYCNRGSKSKNVYIKSIIPKSDNRDSRRIIRQYLSRVNA